MTCLRTFILTLAAMMVLLTAHAQQADQRHVTPVKPETNRVLTPPKGTSEEIIKQYINGDSARAAEQERKDSLRKIYKHYPLLTDVAVGLNFIDPVLMAFGQSYANVDLNVTLNMWNRLQPVLELGVGWANSTPDDMNFTYKSKLAPYVKLGANYNFMFKSKPDYQVWLGLRMGYSSFTYDVTDVIYANSYWQEYLTYDLLGQKSHALWGEVAAGLRVKLFDRLSMGWSIRYHGLFNYGKSEQARPWFIPGYGPRGNSLGLSVSVIYVLPFHHEQAPPTAVTAPDGTLPPPTTHQPPSRP